MHPLDVISGSPNLYLFQKESNKTNFGGFLFLIYLIFIILILIYYIIDYTQNPKYKLQSFTHFNIKTNEEKMERNKNELFNPYLNFNIILYSLKNSKKENISERFRFYNQKDDKMISRNIPFRKRISDFDIVLLYDCENTNCSDYFDFINKTYDRDTQLFLYLEYEGFTLDHQNRDKPIVKEGIFYKEYQLNFNKSIFIRNQWKNIIYNEKKQFLQSDYNESCGYIDSHSSFQIDYLLDARLSGEIGYPHVFICEFLFNINYNQYLEYIREEVSILNLLANVFSLMANIFTGVQFIFSFYSSNFNNFKIIENILNKGEKHKKGKIDKPVEINNFENNNLISIQNDLSEKLGKENNNDNYEKDNEECEEEEDENISNTQIGNTSRIKKLHFFDFFLNNFYSCCKKQRPQKIIHMCNEIIYKYASIDNLIKNQILIENFFKDYKWNNPALNNVENNNLFIQLKTYL